MHRTGRRAAAAACAAALLALGATSTAGATPVPNTTERVTVGSGNTQLAAGGDVMQLSADGCQALIAEWSGTLAPGDDNSSMDVFVRDCETGDVEHVSVDADGNEFPAGVQSPSMTGDGRYVAFVTQYDFWNGTTPGGQLWVFDRTTHTSHHVPVAFGDWEGAPQLWLEDATIDQSGRWVGAMFGGNLWLVDLQAGTQRRIEGAREVDLVNFASQVSTDGDIVFHTWRSLLPEDTDTDQDAYIYDRSSDAIELLSKKPSGEGALHALYPSISANGRYVAWRGWFAGDDYAGAWLVDRQENTVRRADEAYDGGQPDGWLGGVGVSDTCDVVYDTSATNILGPDGEPGFHTYVWNCETGETIPAGLDSDGNPGDGDEGSPTITANGRHVSFVSDSTNLAPGDTNGAWDGFVRHLPVGFEDADDDGVADAIDAGAGQFDDGAGTTGSITSVGDGLTVQVEDAPAPDGVRVTVSEGAGGTVTLTVCAGYTVTLQPGSVAVVTCGSVRAEVLEGEARIVLSDDTFVTVPAGAEAKVDQADDGSVVITDVAGEGVEMTIEGTTKPVTGDTSLATWDFSGFSRPVDGGGVVNVMAAGRTVPLKWRLLDASGRPVTTLATASVRTVARACVAAGEDAVEELAETASTLQNLGGGYYQLNWRTPKEYAGTCRRLLLDLGEGVTRDALFRFTG
ncbi:MAG TPA: PxKF domain-containing protein [Solirubrobacteraceae bacterium]|jgi:hypothetical protein